MQPNLTLSIRGGNAPQRAQVNVLARAIYRLGWAANPLDLDVELKRLSNGDAGEFVQGIDEEEYFISIEKNMSPYDIAETLAHEMIHAYQCYYGALTYDVKGHMVWRGIPMHDVPYAEQPHEILAFGCTAYVLEMAQQLENRI